MSDPKGQHFLPSVYLRCFCDEAGKLHLYDFTKKEFRSNIEPDKAAKMMFNILTNKGEWFFCISETPSEFITTDEPMANMVMLPLSKKVLFMRVTEQIEGLRRIMTAPPDWVHFINCKIASSAKRFLYASSKKKIKEDYLKTKA